MMLIFTETGIRDGMRRFINRLTLAAITVYLVMAGGAVQLIMKQLLEINYGYISYWNSVSNYTNAFTL